jgi:hypothetical protein
MLIEPYKILKELFNSEEKAVIYLLENNCINKYEKCPTVIKKLNYI